MGRDEIGPRQLTFSMSVLDTTTNSEDQLVSTPKKPKVLLEPAALSSDDGPPGPLGFAETNIVITDGDESLGQAEEKAALDTATGDSVNADNTNCKFTQDKMEAEKNANDKKATTFDEKSNDTSGSESETDEKNDDEPMPDPSEVKYGASRRYPWFTNGT